MTSSLAKQKVKRRQTTLIGLVLSIIGLVLVGIVIIGISIYGLDRKDNKTVRLQQPELFPVVPDEAAVYSLQLKNSTVKVNNSNAIEVNLDTKGHSISGAQITLAYDAGKVRVDTVEKGVILDDLSQQRRTGEISISVFPEGENIFKTYNGNGGMATVNFMPLTAGQAEITIQCGGRSSVIDLKADSEDGNVLDCAGSSSASFTIAESGGDSGSDDSDDDNQDSGDDDSDSGTGGSTGISTSNSQPSREPWCKKSYPARPTNLKAETSTQRKQVKLTWTKVEGEVTHYTVTYGRTWVDNHGPNEYGAPNIGNTDQFVVDGLQPGQLYYFVVTAVNDCASSGYSDGASAYAGYGPVSTTTTDSTWSKQAKVTPMPTISPEQEFGGSVGVGQESNATPAPTLEPIVYTPPAEEELENEGLLASLGNFLPYIGFIVLALLGGLFIILVKYVRQQDTDVEV